MRALGIVSVFRNHAHVKGSALVPELSNPDLQDVPEEPVKNQDDNTSPRSRNPDREVRAARGPAPVPGAQQRRAVPCPDRSHRALATLAPVTLTGMETSLGFIPPARQELELAGHFQAKPSTKRNFTGSLGCVRFVPLLLGGFQGLSNLPLRGIS